MRYLLLTKLTTVTILMCLVACAQKVQEKDTKDGFKFSASEIDELLTLLKVDSGTVQKLHIRFSEHLNDSSVIISIWQNQKWPTKDLKVCEILKYKGSSVFIYDTICSLIVPDSLKSKDNQSPFYIPDSGFWEVLAMRRNGVIVYYKISFFVNYEREINDSLSENHFLDKK